MLRILTSVLRNAPGPFRGARALAADMMDGMIDAFWPPPQPPSPASVEPEGIRPEPRPAPVVESRRPSHRPARETSSAKAERGGPPPGDAFQRAARHPEWSKRQDFKVLAILWVARQRNRGAITAKAASALGRELGLTIRHENVRKVVRTRLTEKVRSETVPDSQPPTFRYELTDAGARFFESEYLGRA